MIKRLRLVAKLLWWGMLVLLVAAVLLIMGAKLQGKVPRLFGFSVLQIVTGSMEDTIPTGSYILVRRCEPEEIRKGDIISFYSTDPTISGLPNTHRVAEEPIKTEDGIEFITRGDASPESDKVRARGDRLIGVYVCRLDALSAFSAFLGGGGMLVFLPVLWVLCMALILFNMIKRRTKPPEAPSQSS